ncbi:hypothetical protein [Kaarinaea lacus]
MRNWLITILFLMMAFEADADVEVELLRCANISNANQRLECFDKLASSTKKSRDVRYIQPPEEFLKSELRVNADKSEYKLTIKDFLDLIKAAKIDNGQRITVLGWQQDEEGYVLVIKIRSQTNVRFKYSHSEKENYSVLQPVVIDNVQRAPSVFIYNVAAMSP